MPGVIQSERLRLRRLDVGDEAFILELVNDPAWLRYIGDKNVRTLEEASRYIEHGPAAMYARYGFGLYLTELKDGRVPIGLCGLLKRDTLPDVDIGFAFLPQYRSQGLAFEAASATVRHGREAIGLKRLVAITTPENTASAKLLLRLGMRYEGTVQLGAESESLSLYGVDFEPAQQ